MLCFVPNCFSIYDDEYFAQVQNSVPDLLGVIPSIMFVSYKKKKKIVVLPKIKLLMLTVRKIYTYI